MLNLCIVIATLPKTVILAGMPRSSDKDVNNDHREMTEAYGGKQV